MSSFTAPFDARWHPEIEKWEILSESEFHVVNPKNGLFSRLEVGFFTNGRSVPWPFVMAIPKFGRDIQGAGHHDRAYQSGCLWVRIVDRGGNIHEEQKLVNRKMIDDMYREARIVAKVAKWRHYLIGFGLFAGGWYTWNKYRREDLIQRVEHE